MIIYLPQICFVLDRTSLQGNLDTKYIKKLNFASHLFNNSYLLLSPFCVGVESTYNEDCKLGRDVGV